MPETRAWFTPVDHAIINVSLLTATVGILLPENNIVNSNICKQPDVIDKANDLVIEEDCVTELQLESPEALEDSGAVQSDEECPFA